MVRCLAGLSRLCTPRTTSVSVPVSIHDKRTALVITSIPNDEIAEIWDGVLTQLAVGSAGRALALFLITMVASSAGRWRRWKPRSRKR